MIKKIFRKVLSRKQLQDLHRTETLNSIHTRPQFEQIADIKPTESPKELPVSQKGSAVRVIDDFSSADLKRFTTEEHHAEGTYTLSSKGFQGKCLKVHYRLDPTTRKFRSVDIARKFIIESDVQDWSEYSFLNLVVRMEKPTSLLRVCIVEEDGDWWNFINNQELEGGRWYLVRIPMKDMFLLKDFSIQGDGKQDLSKVAELRIIFDSTNIGQNLTENTAYIDRIFLSH